MFRVRSGRRPRAGPVSSAASTSSVLQLRGGDVSGPGCPVRRPHPSPMSRVGLAGWPESTEQHDRFAGPSMYARRPVAEMRGRCWDGRRLFEVRHTFYLGTWRPLMRRVRRRSVRSSTSAARLREVTQVGLACPGRRSRRGGPIRGRRWLDQLACAAPMEAVQRHRRSSSCWWCS